MSALLLCLGLLAPLYAQAADTPVIQSAAEAEMARTITMSLRDQPPPYYVAYELLDGEVATASAVMGALTSFDHGPYRSLRAEVRVGDYSFDNANFNVSFGERDGVRVRGLPHEDVEVALRRELWLASDSAYKGAAEQFSAKQAARRGRTGEHPPDLYPSPPLVTDPTPRPQADGAWAAEVVQRLTEGLAIESELEEGGAIARDWQGLRVLVSTEGTRAWLPTGLAVVRIEAITRAVDGAKLRNTRSWVGLSAADLPSIDEMAAEVDEMKRWVLALRDAPVESDYLGPVLFEEGAAVELFRQLAVPEISGTPPPERAPDPYGEGETGPPTARVGRRLLPEGWTLVDDPTARPRSAGSYTHDHQGVKAQRVEVVRDGVIRDLLMSRVPRDGFDHSTGHGRSLGADRRDAMPGAVTVRPDRSRSEGRMRRKALQLARQAGLDYVLVVRRIEPPALSEDFHMAFSGDGPLPGLTRPSEVYRLYRDGTEEPVRGLEFLGVDRRVLRDITMAGEVSDPVGVMDTAPGPGRFSIGTVGGLPASWAVPAVLVTELELHGAGGQEKRVIAAPPMPVAARVQTAPEAPAPSSEPQP